MLSANLASTHYFEDINQYTNYTPWFIPIDDGEYTKSDPGIILVTEKDTLSLRKWQQDKKERSYCLM